MDNNKVHPAVIVILVIGGLAALLSVCCATLQVARLYLPSFDRQETPTPDLPPEAGVLTVAYSPEKEELFTALVSAFNSQIASTSPDILTVNAQRYEPDLMIEAAVEGRVDAISPDASTWLDTLDRQWAERMGVESPIVGQTERYAVSPIVIAMWEDVAQEMGYPEQPLGWADLLAKAQSDPNFKWSHPSTNSAAGLLSTMAIFYAGADKTRNLTEADVKAQATLDYVAAVEKTVRHYGEGEWSVIQRALSQGSTYLDAFVCQEQLVVYHNARTTGERLVAVYPIEGTLWEDHPLALLETDLLTDRQRATFNRLVEFLKSREQQLSILAAGYRPTDLDISLTRPDSPLSATNGVDPMQPKTALQMPAPTIVSVIRDVWWYTKRHTNVYLVADVSGSMRGSKLYNAQEALRAFLDQIEGDIERVALVRFSSSVAESVPLGELGQNRTTLQQEIDRLEAGGDTALLDAVALAHERLVSLGDTDRINAIVVMTDGRENNSRTSLQSLTQDIVQANETGIPVIVFCVGYGADADEATLRALAEAGGGEYVTGDLDTIRRLYKILSTYF